MNVRHHIFWYVLLSVTWTHVSLAEETPQSKTVLGPSNVYIYDGANALMAGDGEEGVRLTLKGLETANGFREFKTAHSNLCAGFVMLHQAEKALEHCNWVLERDDRHWRTYNNRALAYLQLKRFEESEADIQAGQALRPGSTNLKIVKGMYLDETSPVTPNVEIDDRRNAAELSSQEQASDANK